MSHDSQSNPAANPQQQAQSPLAQVFQEAYQKAVLIKRLDDQIAQVASRRRALCEELRTIQSQLNDEFGKLVEDGVGAAMTGAGGGAGAIHPAMVGANSPLSIAQPDFASGNGNGIHVTVNPKAFTPRPDAAVA
jgi:hypothetical protein